MKKLFFAFVMMFAVFAMTSCGGQATPADAAKECIELLKTKDFKALVETIDYSQMKAEEQEQAKQMFLAMFDEKGSKMIDEKQGIVSYTLVSEEIAEDGKSAKVKYDITYGDGTTQTQIFELVLVDGVWKQQVKK